MLASAQQRLSLIVVEGEGAVNNVKQRTSRATIVQVEDENHRPVAGAAVIFLLPNDGPGGSFVGGAKTAALVTDSNGQAVMPRMQPNQLTGSFQIRVNASYQGMQAAITITQSNGEGAAGSSSTPPAKPASHTGISGKAIGIIVAVAAAGAVGAAVALRGGGSSQPGTPPATAASGSVTGPTGAALGPPH
jgi:hypothetical protein